ncbi:MAG TPA: histone deacetylase family protein [Sedimentisphaerales bacterium]|nr:histone deacetylase family protein [Sedimentisphaerales bacterium]
MIRIQRVYGSVLPIDRQRIRQAQEIFRQNFPADAPYADKIPDMLDHPFKFGYVTILLVCETAMAKVTGFSLILHFPEINSSLLDFLATGRQIRGGGIGGALFEATQEYLQQQGSRGLFMEVLPDDPAQVKDPALLKENQQRLRFYEQYGIRPIINTEYETPIGESAAPYLLFDGLGRGAPLKRSECRAAMRLILNRKYSHLVTPDYIERVVESVVGDPVRFREPRYVKIPPQMPRRERVEKAFAMICGSLHAIHHVRDRGYVERPARVGALEHAGLSTGLFDRITPRHFGEEHLRAVHDSDFLAYLKVVCEKLPNGTPVYPYVFPIRRPERKPKELAIRAGYYCIDTFTPLDRHAYQAARQAVDVALTGAEDVLRGRRVAYALCRPPGHHAERRTFGGFCYLNNAAIAAQFLARHGTVAMLDIDYHHGNGAQDIFYKRNDVLNISLHGHPNHSYPYFSGFADEQGEGPGKGFNHNFPLPEATDETLYLQTLEKAIRCVERFKPTFLVVCLGFDIMKGDPTGSFVLRASSLRRIGQRIGRLHLPTLVVQEGGYSIRNLRQGLPAFFGGIAQASADEFTGLRK